MIASSRAAGTLISRESILLFTVCSLDMLTSAYLFHLGLAVEANPLLRAAADAGVIPFVTLKSLSFLPAVVYMEWLRRHNPRFALGLLRLAALAYVCIYAVPAVLQLKGLN